MRRAGWIRTLVLVAAVALLEILSRTGVISRLTVIAPSEMVAALWSLLVSGRANADIAATATNVTVAVVLASVAGFALGGAIQAVPRLRRLIEPVLASYYALPIFAFYPLLIVIFGANALPIVAIAFMYAVVAMIINTVAGIDDIPRVLLKVAQIHQLDPWRTALFIKLPAMRPYLFAGLKLVISYAIIGVVASEFILSDHGVGYAIAFAYNEFDNRSMYALMLLIVLFVGVVNLALQMIEQRLVLGQRR